MKLFVCFILLVLPLPRDRENIVMDHKFHVLSWFGRFEPRRRQAVRLA